MSSTTLKVGQVVRVVADDMYRGQTGVIVEDSGPEHAAPLTVEFDSCSEVAFFRADELAPA